MEGNSPFCYVSTVICTGCSLLTGPQPQVHSRLRRGRDLSSPLLALVRSHASVDALLRLELQETDTQTHSQNPER